MGEGFRMSGPFEEPFGGRPGLSMDPVSLKDDVRNCHVLIVEDNVVLQRVLSKWLEKLSIRHTQMFDGAQAVSACEQTVFDVILMDLSMPTLNGIEAAKLIRSRGQNTSTPIVAFSALTGNPDFFDVGINDFLRKPFTKHDLVRKINKWAKVRVQPQRVKHDMSFEDHFGGGGDDQHIDLLDDLPTIFDSFANTLNESAPAQKATRVLVVEDDPVTQRVITTHLRKMGIDVVQAFDGQQAVEACASLSFDVIFMDISMPNMNGLEATRFIRDGTARFTPIIAFSSFGSHEEFSALGLNDYLPKPFTKGDIADMMDKWSPFAGRGVGEGEGPGAGAGPQQDVFGPRPPMPASMVPGLAMHPMHSPRPPMPPQQGMPLGAQPALFKPGPPPGAFAGPVGMQYGPAGLGPSPSPMGMGAGMGMGGQPGLVPGVGVGVGVPVHGMHNGLGPRPAGPMGEYGPPGMMAHGPPKPPLGASPFVGGDGGHMGGPGLGVPLGPGTEDGLDPYDSAARKKMKTRLGEIDEDFEKRGKEEFSRASHNDKERLRRKEISDCVDEFRRMVPGCNDKTDKATTLRMAVSYMKELVRALSNVSATQTGSPAPATASPARADGPPS